MIECKIEAINWSVLEGKDDILFYYWIDQTELSDRITVLDRLTGYSGYIRDIETGYRDINNKFWLASGNFDIRDYPELTIVEAIEKIKKNSNTCTGK